MSKKTQGYGIHDRFDGGPIETADEELERLGDERAETLEWLRMADLIGIWTASVAGCTLGDAIADALEAHLTNTNDTDSGEEET